MKSKARKPRLIRPLSDPRPSVELFTWNSHAPGVIRLSPVMVVWAEQFRLSIISLN